MTGNSIMQEKQEQQMITKMHGFVVIRNIIQRRYGRDAIHQSR